MNVLTPETLAATAAELYQCLVEAAEALSSPAVLESVAYLATEHPEIAWEPVAIAAAAVNAKRELDAKGGALASLTCEVNLPKPPISSVGGSREGFSLPPPPWGFV